MACTVFRHCEGQLDHHPCGMGLPGLTAPAPVLFDNLCCSSCYAFPCCSPPFACPPHPRFLPNRPRPRCLPIPPRCPANPCRSPPFACSPRPRFFATPPRPRCLPVPLALLSLTTPPSLSCKPPSPSLLAWPPRPPCQPPWPFRCLLTNPLPPPTVHGQACRRPGRAAAPGAPFAGRAVRVPSDGQVSALWEMQPRVECCCTDCSW